MWWKRYRRALVLLPGWPSDSEDFELSLCTMCVCNDILSKLRKGQNNEWDFLGDDRGVVGGGASSDFPLALRALMHNERAPPRPPSLSHAATVHHHQTSSSYSSSPPRSPLLYYYRRLFAFSSAFCRSDPTSPGAHPSRILRRPAHHRLSVSQPQPSASFG